MRFAAALLALLALGVGHSQAGGARIATCLALDPTDLSFVGPVCSVTAFIEFMAPMGIGNLGVFGQLSPRGNLEDWTAFGYVYRPDTRFDLLGINITSWPGLVFGRDRGEWIVGFRADLLVTFDWSAP